jgi:hypothetical protein
VAFTDDEHNCVTTWQFLPDDERHCYDCNGCASLLPDDICGNEECSICLLNCFKGDSDEHPYNLEHSCDINSNDVFEIVNFNGLDFSLYPSTMETCFANNEGFF